jgi:uncharacterized protein (DUF983 family)
LINALEAVWRQRCPQCREGAIFRGPLWRGILAMHERCPHCGLKYEREPGYFIGAMYFSYLISLPPALLISIAIWRLSHLSFNLVMVCAFVAYLPLVPAVTRWSRVIWMYVDRHFDP